MLSHQKADVDPGNATCVRKRTLMQFGTVGYGITFSCLTAVQSGQPKQIKISRTETLSGLSSADTMTLITCTCGQTNYGTDAVARSVELKTAT